MVRIFGESVFVGDYGLAINVETDLGLITILTTFPRLNKWIGGRSVYSFSIDPVEEIGWTEDTELHVRNLQTFLHQVIMKALPNTLKTQEIIKRYKEVYAKN